LPDSKSCSLIYGVHIQHVAVLSGRPSGRFMYRWLSRNERHMTCLVRSARPGLA